MRQLETDYLVIGAGATGLAFADTLIDHSDAHITLVDRRGKPGGHWTDAYGFVTLHQPSAFYGVNSTELSGGRKDVVGLNAGLGELASGAEVAGYFDRVMNQRLLPSGRVRWLPMSEHLGDGRVQNLLSGEAMQIVVRRKTVDARYLCPAIPATQAPRFEVGAGVRLLPPGALPGLWQTAAQGRWPERFVVLGAGKTAMDTCIWLLQSGAAPESIRWVMPRDSWLVNRITTQNTPEFFEAAIGGQADLLQALAEAQSVEDLFLRLEACGQLLRIDRERWPTMFHLATVSPAEVALLRQVRDVLRLGRVRSISAGEMVLEQGRVAVEPGTLFIDCTASAVWPRPLRPTFEGRHIVLNMLRLPQPTFSAALIAWVEANIDDERQKSRLCSAAPFPHTLADYPRAMMASLWNQAQWGQHPALRQWMRESRLDGFGKLVAEADRNDAGKMAILARLKVQAMAAMGNLQKLSAAAPTAPAAR